MELFYGGIDLHAMSAQACVIDEKGVAVKERKLDNDLECVFRPIRPPVPAIPDTLGAERRKTTSFNHKVAELAPVFA